MEEGRDWEELVGRSIGETMSEKLWGTWLLAWLRGTVERRQAAGLACHILILHIDSVRLEGPLLLAPP